jgi:[acyl-carrier-protein] S-malonyltransferase
MDRIAFVFSGQGAQYIGMGKSLYEVSPAAKKLYDFADSYKAGTKALSFSGDEGELRQTQNAQPCLYLVDLSAALALNENGIFAECAAGFSLGEVAALAYAGAYTYEDGFKIVCQRGGLMGKAAALAETSMLAVLKLDSETVVNLCQNITDVYPVNFNSPGQTVVAGTKAGLENLKAVLKEYPCRAIDLSVSGGFHSPFMAFAAEGFEKVLEDFEIKQPRLEVYANLTAGPYGNDVKETMTRQITSPVLWQKTIENMLQNGINTFIEVGAGKVLSGLIKKISPDATVYSVEDEQTLTETVKAVKANA